MPLYFLEKKIEFRPWYGNFCLLVIHHERQRFQMIIIFEISSRRTLLFAVVINILMMISSWKKWSACMPSRFKNFKMFLWVRERGHDRKCIIIRVVLCVIFTKSLSLEGKSKKGWTKVHCNAYDIASVPLSNYHHQSSRLVAWVWVVWEELEMRERGITRRKRERSEKMKEKQEGEENVWNAIERSFLKFPKDETIKKWEEVSRRIAR